MKAVSVVMSGLQMGWQCSVRSGVFSKELLSLKGRSIDSTVLKRLFATGCQFHQQQQQLQQQQQQQQQQMPYHQHLHSRDADCTLATVHSTVAFRGVSDRFKGVHVRLDQLPTSWSPSYFASVLKASLDSWTQTGRTSVWLRIPIEKSHLIPEAARLGFRFHHAEHSHSVLCLWLRKDTYSLLPSFATHQIGVAGCVVNSATNKILVIRDKVQNHSLWKFPGGLSDLGEDIDETAKREVWEETGIKTDFHGILVFRQQHTHPDACGRSDLYYICLLTPTTFDLDPCNEEIADCKWMTADEIVQTKKISAVTKRCLQLVKHGLKSGFENVTIRAEECKSIYKGLRMKLYSKNLETEHDHFDLGEYPHDITSSDQFD